MPLYEFWCPGCGRDEIRYMSFKKFDEDKDNVVCETCFEESVTLNNSDRTIIYMNLRISTSEPLVYNTFGHWLDKNASRQPKEFFDDQLEQQRAERDKKDGK